MLLKIPKLKLVKICLVYIFLSKKGNNIKNFKKLNNLKIKSPVLNLVSKINYHR